MDLAALAGWGQYIAGPVLGWVLAAMVATSLYLGRSDITIIPRLVLVWLGSMAVMLIILWIGHFNFDLGPAKTLKSSIGWAKGWALIALFPLAGAMLAVRPEVIYRAVCRLGLVTLILLPIFLFAPSLGLPERLWVSPLKIVGGAGTEYFAAKERNLFWKIIGITAGVALAILSQSRVAYVALVVVAPMVWSVPVFYVGEFGDACLPLLAGADHDRHRFQANMRTGRDQRLSPTQPYEKR